MRGGGRGGEGREFHELLTPSLPGLGFIGEEEEIRRRNGAP
jgi:hypothetical protein